MGEGIEREKAASEGFTSDGYRIRVARPDEFTRLREIEDEAGQRFVGLPIYDETLDSSFPVDALARFLEMGQVWVVCQDDDCPVGMVIGSILDGLAYVEELDVLPAHGRRGLGGRLLAHVCAWGAAQGCDAVTLSTFRDVPWNGPFYRRHGFRDLTPDEWTPGMLTIRQRETAVGLKPDARVFMRRMLLSRPAAPHVAAPKDNGGIDHLPIRSREQS
jgi:GNAT superfamily N-acetyltransferase